MRLHSNKYSNYFIKKYQQNLIMTSILRGNNTLINQYISLRDERRKNNTITLVEEEIEKNVGLVKYIELKLLELLKPEEYKYELRFIFICFLKRNISKIALNIANFTLFYNHKFISYACNLLISCCFDEFMSILDGK